MLVFNDDSFFKHLMRKTRLTRMRNRTIYRNFMVDQLEEIPAFMEIIRQERYVIKKSVHEHLPTLLRSEGKRYFAAYTSTFLRRTMWDMNVYQRGRLGTFEVYASTSVSSVPY